MVPCTKGAEKKTKGVRGDSGSINRQTSTTTSRSGSRRSARHPHCFTSVTPMALPISYRGGEQSQAIKKPQNSENCRSQLWMRNPQKSLGKERLCLREQLTLFTPEEVEQSREVSQGQSKHTTWQTTNAQLEQERLKFKS